MDPVKALVSIVFYSYALGPSVEKSIAKGVRRYRLFASVYSIAPFTALLSASVLRPELAYLLIFSIPFLLIAVVRPRWAFFPLHYLALGVLIEVLGMVS